jgi:cytochrome c oxidase cbb3-type subunit 3
MQERNRNIALKPMLFSAVTFIIAVTSLVSAQTMRGNSQAGQSVYQQHCLRCHGKQLDGNGPDSRDLIVRPTNLLSQASRAKTDWELLVTIANGALFTPMHDFRGHSIPLKHTALLGLNYPIPRFFSAINSLCGTDGERSN